MADPSSPAILPISTTQPTTAVYDGQQPTTDTSHTSPAKAFVSNISSIVQTGLAEQRPWKELLDRSAFSKPQSVAEVTQRLHNNYAYFRINYLIVIAAVHGVSLLTNPKSLVLAAGLIAAWLFLYFFRQASDPPIVLFGGQFSEFEILLVLIFSSAVVIFFTNVGSVLVTALMAGVAIVCLHGAFRNLEDHQETGVSGFIAEGKPDNSDSQSQPPVAVATKA